MRTKADAIEALFGQNPHTELPPVLADWEPDHDLDVYAQEHGYRDARHMIDDGVQTFVSDPAYFDEVTHDAVTARTTRRSVKGRQS